jgi:ABC-type molybdate transport system substrate-binding protein
VKTISLPGWSQPHVKYEIAVVTSSSKKAGATAFIAQVLSKRGQAIMKVAGFGPPKGTVKK